VDDQGVLQRVRSDDLLIDLVRDAPKGKPSP
jgi:hypothetical protein